MTANLNQAGPVGERLPGIGRVLVTGGASGLGLAVAARIEEAGGTPIVFDRECTDSNVDSYAGDVSDRRAVEDTVSDVVGRFGGIDAVVTAAGIDWCGALDEVPAEEWDRVVAVNLFGTVNVVRATLPYLLAAHGHVVTVGSTLALRAVGDATAYCASKFGVLGFTRALAAETRGRLGVTALIPGGMDTSFFDGRSEQYLPADRSLLNAPTSVADAVVFALSQPEGCSIRELLICHESEDSWP